MNMQLTEGPPPHSQVMKLLLKIVVGVLLCCDQGQTFALCETKRSSKTVFLLCGIFSWNLKSSL